MFKTIFIGLFVLFCLSGCESSNKDNKTFVSVDEVGFLFPPAEQGVHPNIAPLTNYLSKVKSVLSSSLPVVLLPKKDLIDEKQELAQAIAIHNGDFLRDVNKKGTGEPLHSEMMSIRPARVAELTRNNIKSIPGIYRVEMYNFFYNTSTIAFIDLNAKRVIFVKHSTSTPTVVNPNLQHLAKEIALSAPETLETLQQTREDANKLPFRINTTKCERSRHLCVAAVFTKGKKDLWVIVDLTDMDIVGYDWVSANPNRPAVVTERSLQNEYVVETFCGTDNELKKDHWDITYTLTGSDGLEVKDVKFNGATVLTSAKIVDWHVTYEFKKGFGYSDAVGCPMFSAAAVVAFNGPQVEDITKDGKKVGFALVQDFRSPVWPLACNYRYQNRFEFYQDGKFRVTGVNLGLGCGKGGWYRPVFRIALAADQQHGQVASKWGDNQWQPIEKESWFLQDSSINYSPEGYIYQIRTGDLKGYYLEPGQGQFGDGGRGDHAYSYLTVDHNKEEEGSGNLPTFGFCCNTNYEQGPEAFMSPAESLNNENLIIWYVPQMANDDTPGKEYCWVIVQVRDGHEYDQTFAGVVGPMFVPFNKTEK